jgi:RNA polymerase sigma-70 factor (ECF subfamily)
MNGTGAPRELGSDSHRPQPGRAEARGFIGFGRKTISTVDTDQLRQLLAECSLGNRRSFEQLYRITSARLHGVAVRCVGRRELAEEIVQESFVRIWNNASRYDANLSAPLTWMVNITRHLAIDLLRRRHEEPLGDLQLEALTDNSPAADEQLSSARQARALNRCLDDLEGMQRQSILTAYFHGLSNADLASHLGAPLGSVKSWIRRGMERLRRCLES